jgi:hypothetical protein
MVKDNQNSLQRKSMSKNAGKERQSEKGSGYPTFLIEERLKHELERLKRDTGLGFELDVVWMPQDNKLSGEVKGKKIYVYEEDEEKAIETLYHEFFDYAVSRAIEPYRSVLNSLISCLNEMCYRRKEEVVEGLRRFARKEEVSIRERKKEER